MMEAVMRRALSLYNNQPAFVRNALKICGVSCIYLFIRGIYIRLYRKYKQLPPGPVGYPIFGCFISMIAKGHYFYIDMARAYNCKYKLCTIPLGSLQAILINNDKLLKQILKDESSQWTPTTMFLSMDVPHNVGFMEGGSNWKQRRKYFQTNLITMLNKKYLDNNVKKLMKQFLFPKLDKIANQRDNNKNIWHWDGDFPFFTFNIMYNCVFGGYLERNDVTYNQYEKNEQLLGDHMQFSVFLFFLFGEKIATFLRKNLLGNKSDFYLQKNQEIIRKWIINAHKNYDEDNLKTFYDYTYYQLSQQKSPNAYYDEIITKEVIADLEVAISASVDTTAHTLSYWIVIASKHTKAQQEVYQELDNVFNLSSTNIDNINILDNIQSLHKLRAFIFEVLRLNPVLPAGFRQIRKENGLEINVDGNKYILPDKSLIIQNILGMQMNPKLWNNPDKFDMNRWLDKNKKFNRKLNPTIMNFSFGERDCPGRPLAMKTLYLVIAILFVKYKFYFEEPDEVKIKQKLGITLEVHPGIPCKVSKR